MALSRRDASNIVSALSEGGQNVQFLYNDGDAVFTDTYRPPGNMFVYNAPGSTVKYVSGAYKCGTCQRGFDTKANLDAHEQANPKKCGQHQMCFDTWANHVNQHRHTSCPIPYCGKKGVDFGYDARFMQHFRNKH